MPGVISAPWMRSSASVVPAVSLMRVPQMAHGRGRRRRLAALPVLLHPLRREHLEVPILHDEPRHLPNQEMLGRIALVDRHRGDQTALPVLNGFQRLDEALAG